jgi:hypothetical protein
VCLQSRAVTQCAYLEGEGPDGLGPHLRHVALYHSSDGNRGRSVYCLLMPATRQCLVVVCVPSGEGSGTAWFLFWGGGPVGSWKVVCRPSHRLVAVLQA